MTSARATFDHETVRRWAERSATPSSAKATGSGDDPGILRLDFPGYSGEESLQPISWEEWFEKFEENLARLLQEETSGGAKSNFNKLVDRGSVDGD